VIQAINTGRIPPPFQEHLQARANELVNTVNCPATTTTTQSETTEEKKPKKEKKKKKDEEEQPIPTEPLPTITEDDQ
jgi:hypothetical protein